MTQVIAIAMLLMFFPAAQRAPMATVQNSQSSVSSTPRGKAEGINESSEKNQDQQTANEQAGKDENNPVFVRVLPDLSVRKDRADYIYLVGSLLLTLLTLGIAVIALAQAKAAILNAEAVINSQRAWVVVSPSELRPLLGFIPEPGDALNEPGRDRANVFYVLIKNVGITPARILKTCAVYQALTNFKELPHEPHYPKVPERTGIFLFNRKDTEGRDEALGQLAYLSPNQVLTKKQVEAVQTGTLFLYAYGFVAYEDAFKRAHVTRFGYVYNFPQGGELPLFGFKPAGPDKYNEAT